ncbi:hypothetical protein B0T13DRAFT_512072 [Neurospora crassa]|nr:hypothetical protein B0T13DRAFT_512072 [Neurospora crassa]
MSIFDRGDSDDGLNDNADEGNEDSADGVFANNGYADGIPDGKKRCKWTTGADR